MKIFARFTFIVILFALPFTARAQHALAWTELNAPEEAFVISSLATSDGVWWSGTRGGIYSSTNQGRQWQRRGLDLYDVCDIAEFPRGILLAATNNGLMKTSDNGLTWDRISGYSCTHIRFLAGGGIVLGTGSGVAYSTDSGATFTMSISGLTDKEILSMAVHPSGKVVVGTHSGVFLCDSIGKPWRYLNDPALMAFCDALAVSPGGILYAGLLNKHLATSTDAGNTWSLTPDTPVMGYFRAILAPDELRVIYAVDYGYGCAHGQVPPGGTRRGIYRSSDRGATWKNATANLEGPRITSLAPAGKDQWLLGTAKGVFVSKNDMQSWQESNGGMHAFHAYANHTNASKFPTSESGILTNASGTLVASGPSGLRSSTDGGSTWRDISPGLPELEVNALALYNDGSIYAILPTIDTQSDTLWISDDGGASWRIIAAMPGDYTQSMAVDQAGNIFAGSIIYNLAFSSDRGATWVDRSPLINSTCWYVSVGEGGEVLAAMDDGLHISHDLGKTWTKVYAGVGGDIKTTLRTRKGTLILGFGSGRILRSTDDGQQWTEEKMADNSTVWEIKENASGLYAIARGMGMLRSTDDGDDWIMEIGGLSNLNPTSFTITKDGDIFLGTYGNGIYRAQSPVSAAEAVPDPKEAVALLQNYPNPCADRTAIPFTLSRASHVRIDVMDAIGRIVATVMDGELPAGVHRAEWLTGGLPAGVYRCRIAAGSASASRWITVAR
jgi:photosystem II stability/assembly factor-like uncharacterized protein